MAFKKLQAAKSTLQNPDVGQRVKDEGKRAFAEWKAQHEQALDVIQELYITYFSQTMEVYKGLSLVQGWGLEVGGGGEVIRQTGTIHHLFITDHGSV